jgi:multimeric flavodoxin WrbA
VKIVIINASPRKAGASSKILSEFEHQLNEHRDVEAVLYHLSELEIGYCKGCCSCYKTGECIINDDAEILSRKISEADGLIIGSPNYASAISGQLKTFIDRGHYAVEQLLKNTYTIPIITYENADGSSALKYLKKLFTVSGGINVGAMLIKTPLNKNPLDKKRVKKQIKKLSRRLHTSIQKKAAGSLYGKIFHAVALRFVFKPLVKRKGTEYQGVIDIWKKRGI